MIGLPAGTREHVRLGILPFGIAFWVVLFAAVLQLCLLPQASLCAGANEKIETFVSILPQAYFVERVGGDPVEVEVLVGPGRSPATYEPTPRQMARLARARVYFRIGVPFEDSLLKKITGTFRGLRVVETHKGIKRLAMPDLRHHDDRDHRHAAGKPDPHVWLDPRRVKLIARTICDELGRLDPARAAVFQENLKAFHTDLDALDARIAKTLAPLKGRTFFVFHPSYGYFADRYGLKQVAVETGGKQPSARQLAALIESAKKDGVKIIFVQPQFSKNTAETIARAIGGAVVPLDPLARDYMKNLEGMAAKLAAALKPND